MQAYSVMMNNATYNVRKNTEAVHHNDQEISKPKQHMKPSNDVTGYSVSRLRDSAYAKLRAVTDAMTDAAQSIRHADRTMEEIGKTLDMMVQQADITRKDYPPFPAGSEDRVNQLRMIKSLRNMIDRLTFPPENSGAAQIMANSEGHPGADGLEIAAGAQGEHSFVIRAEVHTGETGLNIPELSETASDEELAEFISSVRTAKKTLTNRRMELSAGMDRIRRTSDMNARVMNAGETGENTQQTADLAEDVVELKSSEIGLSLGVSMMGSLQSIREGLAELWN